MPAHFFSSRSLIKGAVFCAFISALGLNAQQPAPTTSRLPTAFAPAPPRVAAAIPVSSPPALDRPAAANTPAPGPLAAAAPAQEPRDNYVLSANDLIQVQVFQEPDLSIALRVGQDGTVTFPLIGRLTVGGLSPQAAATTIQDLLGKDYLVNPQVSVTVTDYSKRRFTILGQVQKPGSYDMPDRDNLPLLSAIGMAGGYTRIADPSRITVKRRQSSRESLIKLDAKKMAAGRATTSFDVLPGDIISVGESLF